MKKIIHNASVIQKIQKEQRRQKVRNAWNQIKDMILMLILLNTLINNLQKIDIAQVWPAAETKTIVIERNIAPVAHAEEQPIEITKTTGTFTAYSVGDGYTPGTIMASGKKVYEGAVANNCLDLGTKIKVNGKVKVVEDRMKSDRDCSHFDIYMATITEAKKFGKQDIEYEVIK
jgi:3D (Asp-Asp-Asp) domain-containing protein